MAPFWLDQFDVVVSMSMSGFGASGWRSEYAFVSWADEVLAVARHVGMQPEVRV